MAGPHREPLEAPEPGLWTAPQSLLVPPSFALPGNHRGRSYQYPCLQVGGGGGLDTSKERELKALCRQ